MKKLIMKLLGKRKTSLGFKVKDLEIFPSKRKYLAAQHDYSMLGRDIVFKDEGETRMGVVVKDYISSDLSRHYTTINRVTGEESDVDIHNVFKVEGVVDETNITDKSGDILNNVKEYCTKVCFMECSIDCPLDKYKFKKNGNI